MRSRLKADVRARLNELMVLANIDRKYGPECIVQNEIMGVVMGLLRADSSWVPTEVMAIEAQTAREATGINFGLQLAVQDSVVSNRELSYVALPLLVADLLAGERS